ncbi:MAG: FctA domain-containing protein, partial [Clostridiales bacterium]|nr:FctA domain-containing protein [Clostridiales bacterium]
EYDKYELVESADKNKTAEGTFAKKYVPDTVTRTGVVRYAKRLQRVVNENGDAVVEMWILDPEKVNVKEYNAEQETGDAQIQTDKYKKIFETPILKSGEWNSTAFEWNWEEDWVKKAGLKSDNSTVKVGFYSVNNGGLLFPRLTQNNEMQYYQANWFRLQNDNNPRSDAYYYYVEKGSVMVHYEDTEGNVIQNPVTDTAHGVTGSGYNTTDHKDTSIKFNGETYYLVQKPAQKQIQANDAGVKTALATDTVTNNKLITETTSETGEVRAATEIHLTYVYEKAGNVKVNYFGVDEHGNVLDPLSGATTGIDKTAVSTTEYVTKDAQSGTEYHTRTFKPATIRDAQGRIWRLVTASNPHPVTDGDAEAGTVVSGATKAVNYYYALETPAPSGGNGGGGGGSSSHTPKPASVTLIAAKALNGAAPAGSSFTFFLNDANGQQLQAKNNQDGAVTFDALTFNQTGAYVYYLTEQTGNDKNINYDTASYKVTVTVTCPYDYEASVAYEKDGQAYQGVPAFANTTKPAVPVPEQIAPAVATARALDKVPKTEDSSGLALWGILAAASFLSLTVLLAGNKMRKASSQGKEHQS